IRDRVVQGALKLILEPIFEADFQPGSFGYRPKKTAHEAVDRVAQAIVQCKTRVIDFDLRSYFDNVQHDLLLAKVAKRVDDDDVMHLLKIMSLSCFGSSCRPKNRGWWLPEALTEAPATKVPSRSATTLVEQRRKCCAV